MKQLIVSVENFKQSMPLLRTFIIEALASGSIVVALKRVSKTREQEKYYHVLIAEILDQGYTLIGLEPTFKIARIKLSDLIGKFGKKPALAMVKNLLVHQYYNDCLAMGEPLRAKGASFLEPESMQLVHSRPSTTQFSVKEGSNFIEWLYAKGIEMEVRWSATAEQIKMLEGRV